MNNPTGGVSVDKKLLDFYPPLVFSRFLTGRLDNWTGSVISSAFVEIGSEPSVQLCGIVSSGFRKLSTMSIALAFSPFTFGAYIFLVMPMSAWPRDWETASRGAPASSANPANV